eukprot:scaffold772_cov339-Pavlova_lutheri.AAC.86
MQQTGSAKVRKARSIFGVQQHVGCFQVPVDHWRACSLVQVHQGFCNIQGHVLALFPSKHTEPIFQGPSPHIVEQQRVDTVLVASAAKRHQVRMFEGHERLHFLPVSLLAGGVCDVDLLDGKHSSFCELGLVHGAMGSRAYDGGIVELVGGLLQFLECEDSIVIVSKRGPFVGSFQCWCARSR